MSDLNVTYEYPVTKTKRGEITYKGFNLYNFWVIADPDHLWKGDVELNGGDLIVELYEYGLKNHNHPRSHESLNAALAWIETEIVGRHKEDLESLCATQLTKLEVIPPDSLEKKYLFEIIEKLIEHKFETICRHGVALDLLNKMEEQGIPWPKELAATISENSAGDTQSLEILRKLR